MIKTIIRFIILAGVIALASATPVLAGNSLIKSSDISQLESVVSGLTSNTFSVAEKQPYNQDNDPAFRSFKAGPVDESPQHGYFAVPLLVIGIATILIFLSRND